MANLVATRTTRRHYLGHLKKLSTATRLFTMVRNHFARRLDPHVSSGRRVHVLCSHHPRSGCTGHSGQSAELVYG
jgi:hypothetical protein